MSTISTYAELKDAVQKYSKRNDSLSMLDTFIDLTEADIWEALRVKEMDVLATASASTVERFLPLPNGFIKMRRLKIQIGGIWHDMNSRDLKNMNILDSVGVPWEYAITSEIEFNRIADIAYPLEMQYYVELDALSSTNTTNDVLLNYPKIYLAGCLHQFYQWALMEDKAEYWSGIFDKEVARANRKSRLGRYGPAPAMSVQGMVV
jgi:hypothetical protein